MSAELGRKMSTELGREMSTELGREMSRLSVEVSFIISSRISPRLLLLLSFRSLESSLDCRGSLESSLDCRARDKTLHVLKRLQIDEHLIAQSMVTKHGQKAIFETIKYGFLKGTRWLIDQGADVNLGCAHGWTPLILSVVYRREEIFKMLLEAGAVMETYDMVFMNAAKYAKMFDFKEGYNC